MRTPLDRFMDQLKKRGSTISVTPRRHIHSTGPNVLNGQGLECDGDCDHVVTLGNAIWWEGAVDGIIRGPACVAGTFEDGDDLWCWFTHENQEHMINTRLVVKVVTSKDGDTVTNAVEVTDTVTEGPWAKS
jgi:hypothetical protein